MISKKNSYLSVPKINEKTKMPEKVDFPDQNFLKAYFSSSEVAQKQIFSGLKDLPRTKPLKDLMTGNHLKAVFLVQ
jgi:hypothetical protein